MSRIIIHISIVSLLAASMLAHMARAAVYNFYFNNTEQGNNSTATPTITLRDGKNEGVEAKTIQIPNDKTNPSTSAEKSTEKLPQAASVTNAAVIPSSKLSLKGKLRLDATALYTPSSHLLIEQDPNKNYTSQVTAIGGMVGFGIFPVKYAGIHLYGGTYQRKSYFSSNSSHFFGGAEVEMFPVNLSIGQIENAVQVGALFGSNTLENPVIFSAPLLYAGARLNISFAQNWGLTAAARMDVNRHYALTDAGLSFRL